MFWANAWGIDGMFFIGYALNKEKQTCFVNKLPDEYHNGNSPSSVYQAALCIANSFKAVFEAAEELGMGTRRVKMPQSSLFLSIVNSFS